MELEIQFVDPILLRASDHSLLLPVLFHKESRRRMIDGRKQEVFVKAYEIKPNGEFLAGYLPRVREYCERAGIAIREVGFPDPYKFRKTPKVPFSFHPHQMDLIAKSLAAGRGVIVSPTGSGKTVIFLALACYVVGKTLVLVHTKSLVRQIRKEAADWGLPEVSIVDADSKDLSGEIVVGTVQSFSNLPPESYCDLFDCVIIDEAHHVSSNKWGSWYARVLSSLLAEARFGLTATTYRRDTKQFRSMEGLLGPVIGEFTLEEAEEQGIVVRPNIVLVPVPLNPLVKMVRTYRDIYNEGVVNYRLRNRRIVEIIRDLSRQGKSSVTYVREIEHGENIVEIGDRMGIEMPFIYQATSAEDRERYRDALHRKEILAVVASNVWKEGVNIKSLDAIILGAGGRGELALLQTIGRVVRKHDGKDEARIYDFLDIGNYISTHTVERIGLYIERGWPILGFTR